MRIVIFHGSLALPTGGEVNTRDWARALKARGHRVVVFTVYPGPLAEQIHNCGIAVVDNPAAISDRPDIIFGAGVNDVAILLARFPDVPAIQVAQVFGHWNNHPCELPQVVLHVAVDELNAEMLINEFGVPRERVRIVYNAVDVARLPARPTALAPRPARALIFVKEKHPYMESVRAACAARGIALEEIGHPVGRPVDDPVAAMSQCDLVFGSARTALEAGIAGAAVVVADHRGLAGMLTMANLGHFRHNNFGRALLTGDLDSASIGAEIDRYDPVDAAAVSQALRQDATLDRQIDQLEAIFVEAIELFKRLEPSAEEARRALAAYLAQHLPRPAAGEAAPRQVRFPPQPWIDAKLAAIEQGLSATAGEIAALHERLSAMAGNITALEQRPVASPQELAAVVARASALGEDLRTSEQRLATVDQRISVLAEHLRTSILPIEQRVGAAEERARLLDDRIATAEGETTTLARRLSPVEGEVFSVRPLIRLMRPVALVLGRLSRVARFFRLRPAMKPGSLKSPPAADAGH
ncbi:MAG: hypothetical protein ACJ8F2_15055 [Xanthobacteraceae bacterium]